MPLRYEVGRKSFHRFFIVYFTLIQAAGLLSAVLASGEVTLSFSGQLLCYVKTEDGSTETSITRSDGHSHKHSSSDGVDHHQAETSSDPNIPLLHCNPLPAFSFAVHLSVPVVVPESQTISDQVGTDVGLFQENIATSFRNEAPPTPPPRDLLS